MMTAPTVHFITALQAQNFTLDGIDWRDRADGDERFAAWLILVNYEMREKVGFGLDGIPERDWRPLYAADLDPAEAAIQACIDLLHDHEEQENRA